MSSLTHSSILPSCGFTMNSIKHDNLNLLKSAFTLSQNINTTLISTNASMPFKIVALLQMSNHTVYISLLVNMRSPIFTHHFHFVFLSQSENNL